MTKTRTLTFVQQRIAAVRAERRAILERAAERYLRDEEADRAMEHRRTREAAVVHEPRPLLRGEIEPEVIIAEDGSVRLAPLEWSTEATDAGEQ